MKHLAGLRPSPAMVVALVALSVALGGVGYAATVLPSASVGTTQLKSNAVTSAKVKNGSLTVADFRAGQLPAGPAGPVGAPGASGPPGAPGPAGVPGVNAFGKLTYVEGAPILQGPGTQSLGVVTCPPGERPVGGGVLTSATAPGVQAVNSTFPTNTAIGAPIDSWAAFVDNLDPIDNQSFVVYVLCAPATNVTANFKRAPSKR